MEKAFAVCENRGERGRSSLGRREISMETVSRGQVLCCELRTLAHAQRTSPTALTPKDWSAISALDQ